jgi:hypothetical protein
MSNKVANEEKETSPMIKFSEDHKVKKDAQVGIQVVVRRIYDIDNIRQTFGKRKTNVGREGRVERQTENRSATSDVRGEGMSQRKGRMYTC